MRTLWAEVSDPYYSEINTSDNDSFSESDDSFYSMNQSSFFESFHLTASDSPPPSAHVGNMR